MGGTGIRCLFDSTKKQRIVETRSKSRSRKDDKKRGETEVCEKEEVQDSNPCDQQQENGEGLCECQQSSVVACCKPGCSNRMPCIACTRSGCKMVIPNKVLKKKDCTCGKSKCDTKLKIRSRSEGRVRAKSVGREICDSKPKNKVRASRKKTSKDEDSCDEKLSPKDSCESTDELLVIIEPMKSKSPCRKLEICPCDRCKNVTFKDKCEVIPETSTDQDEDSCSEDNFDVRQKVGEKPKQIKCTPKKPNVTSDSPKTSCNPAKIIAETSCQCSDCKIQQQPKKNKAREKNESCDVPVFNEVSSMMPPTFVMQRMGNTNWSTEISCPFGPNYGNSLYQNSYASPPSFNRQF